MGLGLPIVKNVIDTLGGRILIKSNPDKKPGTKINIILNRHFLTPENPVNRPAKLPMPLYSNEDVDIADTPFLSNRSSILLVEDNKTMLQFIKKKLQLKYNIFIALNGAEALKKLHELSIIPDIIISDIMMDKMDGYSFAKTLSEVIEYSHIPIIFLSARSAPADKLKGLRLGAIDFIQKPFSSEELLQKIESVLGNISKQKRAILQSAISHLKTTQPQEDIVTGNLSISLFDKNCKLYNLTSREIDIVKLIRQGSKYKNIAETLFISDRTVTKHVQNIFEKVGVSNKAELIHKLES
jgi:DNA-binding NarL/FixJ family response regulator